MERYTQKQLKNLVKAGIAIDVTNASEKTAIPENYKQVVFLLVFMVAMVNCLGV